MDFVVFLSQCSILWTVDWKMFHIVVINPLGATSTSLEFFAGSRSLSSVLSHSLQLTFEVPPPSTPQNGAVELQGDYWNSTWLVDLKPQGTEKSFATKAITRSPTRPQDTPGLPSKQENTIFLIDSGFSEASSLGATALLILTNVC